MAVSRRPSLSRDQKRDLDIEISFLAGLTRRDPGYVEALQILGDDYTRRGKFEEGLQVDLRLAQLRPDDPLAHYNLACSYALTDRHDAAFAELNLALDKGYRDFGWLAKDPDLAGFRKHPLYRRLRARIRALRVEIR
jgi:tetratricopeptide (TPR) repeat protein